MNIAPLPDCHNVSRAVAIELLDAGFAVQIQEVVVKKYINAYFARKGMQPIRELPDDELNRMMETKQFQASEKDIRTACKKACQQRNQAQAEFRKLRDRCVILLSAMWELDE